MDGLEEVANALVTIFNFFSKVLGYNKENDEKNK